MRNYVALIDYVNREGRAQVEPIDLPCIAGGNREAAHRALHNAPEFVRKNAFAITIKFARSGLVGEVAFAVTELTGKAAHGLGRQSSD